MEYLTNTSELTTVADAIRDKGGTSAPLTYPFGFVSAIQDIQAGGNVKELVEGTISGVYENSTVTSLGSFAFWNCNSMATVNIPSCETIGDYAFYGCSALTGGSFDSVITVSKYAFYSCDRLSIASFPACTSLGSQAFGRCHFLKTASFPVCETIESGAFNIGGLTDIYFPECKTIGSNVFYNQSLPAASFPKCTSIGSNAFWECTMLTELYLMGSSVATLADRNAFSSTPIGGYSASAGQYGSIYVPASLLTAYQAATNWTYFSSRFVGVQE